MVNHVFDCDKIHEPEMFPGRHDLFGGQGFLLKSESINLKFQTLFP